MVIVVDNSHLDKFKIYEYNTTTISLNFVYLHCRKGVFLLAGDSVLVTVRV